MKGFSPRMVLSGILVLFIAAVLVIMGMGIISFNKEAEAEQIKAAQALIERAVVQCYALEGAYPPNLDYLSNYGVSLNHDKYLYVYQVIGANVLPIVEVKVRN